MRERWARWLAAFTGVLVLLLSAGFALWQNRDGEVAVPGDAIVTAAPAIDTAQAQRGRAVYDEQGCARCHSIAGKGSPRSVLDGVASRLDRQALRHFVTADPAVADALAARVRASKEDYATLPASQLEALLDYLQTLHAEDSDVGQ